MNFISMEDENESILFFPGGDLNMGKLEGLLEEAHESKRKPSERIECLRRVRTSEDDADTPKYELEVEKHTVAQLQKLYESVRQYPFTPTEIKNEFHAIAILIYDSRTGFSGVYDIGS